jgi:hypothetical protein
MAGSGPVFEIAVERPPLERDDQVLRAMRHPILCSEGVLQAIRQRAPGDLPWAIAAHLATARLRASTCAIRRIVLGAVGLSKRVLARALVLTSCAAHSSASAGTQALARC